MEEQHIEDIYEEEHEEQEEDESEIDYEIAQYKHLIYKKAKTQYDMHLKLKFLKRYHKYLECCINYYYSYDQDGNRRLLIWSFDEHQELIELELSIATVENEIKKINQNKHNYQIFKKELEETYIKKCLHPTTVYKYITKNDIDFGELNIDDLIF